jgi:histidinol phosphatase-like PHP family hydrolase
MNFKTFYESIESIRKLAKDNDMDVSKYSDSELLSGMEIEKEHDGGEGEDVDVVKSELDILKIVIAHLREDPNYYKKLKKAGL